MLALESKGKKNVSNSVKTDDIVSGYQSQNNWLKLPKPGVAAMNHCQIVKLAGDRQKTQENPSKLPSVTVTDALLVSGTVGEGWAVREIPFFVCLATNARAKMPFLFFIPVHTANNQRAGQSREATNREKQRADGLEEEVESLRNELDLVWELLRGIKGSGFVAAT